jgi:predicted amidohydrolase
LTWSFARSARPTRSSTASIATSPSPWIRAKISRFRRPEKRGNIALTFTGKSQIVTPKGEVLAQASERSESLKVVEVDPAEALDKHVTPNNDLFKIAKSRFKAFAGR